jgi:MFS family permease
MQTDSMFRRFLERHNGWVLSLIAGIGAFGTYSCMYAFRKAFAAGTYSGDSFFGVDYKMLLITAQVLGYMLSKFIGIRYVSGMRHERRSRSLLLLIGGSWMALLGFALVPAPWNILFLFLNGIPLGMIWGLVFSYLEGRKNTELMGAIMSVSIVSASGFVKTIGRFLLQEYHVQEYWMPFMTGLIFVLPLCLFAGLLQQIPAPTVEDKALRTERLPMTKSDQKRFVSNFRPGIILIIIIYLLLTVARDMRDNFEVEIWSDLGFGGQPSIFTRTDFPIALCVLVMMALLIKVKDNLRAFTLIHYMILCGLLIVLGTTLLFNNGFIGPVSWMSFAGLGLFMAYIPYNCIYFERLIASFRYTSNVGFVMYIADATGYLGTVSVLFVKQFTSVHVSWLFFFKHSLVAVAVLGMIGVVFSLLYFRRKYARTFPVPLSI